MSNAESLRIAFITAFKNTFPILISFLILGIAYGILMDSKGYGFPWPLIMSAICFCGSMQFVAITLLCSAFDPVQAFLMSLLVNCRHCFYSVSLLEPYKKTGKIAPFLIYTLCDETFSVICSLKPPQNIQAQHYYFAVSLLNYLYWVIGSGLGCIADNILFFNTKGMDFALTALFLVMFIEQCRDKASRRPALFGLIITAICLVLFGSQNFILPAMAIIMFSLFFYRRLVQC